MRFNLVPVSTYCLRVYRGGGDKRDPFPKCVMDGESALFPAVRVLAMR